MQRSPHEEFALKPSTPKIMGSGVVATGDKFTTTYDLVEKMEFLYVRVVKARHLPSKDMTGGCDPYVEVKIGNYKGHTSHFEKKSEPIWNHVFAFSYDTLQASYLEVVVKDKDVVADNFIGKFTFDLHEVPKRRPPDSPLAPQWYQLTDKKGVNIKHGEIMLAVWNGTQADEAFSDATHSGTATVSREGISNIQGKVYLAPKLWYVRVTVIQCQDLLPSERIPNVRVVVSMGNQLLPTKVLAGVNAMWNEDLVLVTAEPFEELLIIHVEEIVGSNKVENLGKCTLKLQDVPKRYDAKLVPDKWHNLEKHIIIDGEKKEAKYASKIHLRVCLDGGYHVLDESTHCSSDLTPSARQLSKSSIGLLEIGIISAKRLSPMKSRDGIETTDAFCVAKYGRKWVRTRTIISSVSPCWNEQYTWEVYDPCTVVTICVFDNGHFHGGGKDLTIGKVRIRLSTLETDRVYTHHYPLIVLKSSGVKKMGEIQLAVRFSCISFMRTMQKYTHPLLPKMHYVHPISMSELAKLRNDATLIVTMRLNRAEPPLTKEVVDYMLDMGSHLWSLRRSKSHFERVKRVFSGLIAVGKWFDQICQWKNPFTTILIHILFCILIFYPELILPTIFLYLFFIGIWRYRLKPKHPPHMDVRLSLADIVSPDELDEEFDTFPSTKGVGVVRNRYDRLRIIGGKVQTVLGDLATQGERFESLLNWRDPRASALFVIFCFIFAIVLYITPFKVVALVWGFYVLRHPKLRSKVPSLPINFFRRLPAKTDCMF